MNEKINSEMISRRGTFSLVWKAAAASLAVPAVVMLASSEDAEAQTQTKQRRDTRQEGRQGKRDQRRN
jgi:hypothetical protein